MDVAPNIRFQLSLYVPPPHAALLENVRRLLDPVQFGLIPVHVTLCREDELDGLDFERIATRLVSAGVDALTLHFGKPERFSSHGIRLPCVAGGAAFDAMRRQVLGATVVRCHVPHITLAHPRNPCAAHNSLSDVGAIASELAITFTQVSLIRQDGSSAWKVLGQQALAGHKRSAD